MNATATTVYDNVTRRFGEVVGAAVPTTCVEGTTFVGEEPWIYRVRWSGGFESWIGYNGLAGYDIGHQTSLRVA